MVTTGSMWSLLTFCSIYVIIRSRSADNLICGDLETLRLGDGNILSNTYEWDSEKRVFKAFQQLIHNRHLKNA